MYVWKNGWIGRGKDDWMDGQMDGWIAGWMGA